MKTVEMALVEKFRKEIEALKAENGDLRAVNSGLEQRLKALHGEYEWLRYQLHGMPSQAEVLRLHQEMLALKWELRMRGWTEAERA